ncbi:MAG TPA: DUF2785 domain-containing protein [Anaerolineae bacterium]|nr:DUF2785 domain-containing protein [Anaerolineae bacterium]
MLTEQALKDQLQIIASNDFKLPDGLDRWMLAQEMLAHLGSIDPELRDDLIYRTLSRWALRDQFNTDQLRQLLSIVTVDRHLFYRIGEKETDSVFTRTFSMLSIVLPLFVHRRSTFLSPDDVRSTLAKALDYLAKEKDWRGYIDGKGWAHAAAHSADVLDELAQCNEIERGGLLQILEAIRTTMSIDAAVFTHEEDERMAYATLSLIGRGLLIERDIEPWIRSFAPIEEAGGVRDVYRRVNVKTYLRCLFFQATRRRSTEWITVPINETLYAISKFR